ncbi:MAG: SUMF1/EgtB/PvdO family nonheme iron enzyme [Defluviicoccus sp.]
MRRTALVHLLVLTLSVAAPMCPAWAETRIALVIGNGAYPSGPLGSPKDDAKAIDAKLTSLGFQVTRKTDLARDKFFDAIRDFGERLQQRDTVGLFYYSGHGMQVNNRNYMIPTDADIRSELDVGRFAVPVDDVLVRMDWGKSNPNIVILDACRNNPFEKRFKSSSDGLAAMEAPPSTLIVFAAAPGRVAEAGSGGKLSLYTAALVEHIDEPHPNFVAMFQAVQNAVFERSGRSQAPRLELSPGLPNFSFKPLAAIAPPPIAAPPIAAPLVAPPPQAPPVQPAVGVSPRTYKALEIFKDCDSCPEMVALPGGTFTMGSPQNEEGRDNDEGPQHQVRITPFAIGKTEVTFAEWDACVAADGCNRYRPDDRWGRGSQPVINVSWDDAKAYVAWLARQTGQPYRLPTESEWEYAARAGTKTPFSFGQTISTRQANYNGNDTYGSGSKGEYRQQTVPAGSLPANPWGVHEVHGNVWEWVEDCYHDSYRAAPADGRAWVENSCAERVVRGGSWDLLPGDLRSAYRSRYDPVDRIHVLGFRVARTFTP